MCTRLAPAFDSICHVLATRSRLLLTIVSTLAVESITAWKLALPRTHALPPRTFALSLGNVRHQLQTYGNLHVLETCIAACVGLC